MGRRTGYDLKSEKKFECIASSEAQGQSVESGETFAGVHNVMGS